MTDGRAARALLLTPVLPSDRGNGLAMRSGLLLKGLAASFATDVVVPPSAPTDASGRAFVAAHAEHVRVLPGVALDPDADTAALLGTPQARLRTAAVRPLPSLCQQAPPRWAAHVAQLAAGVSLVVVFRSYLAPLLDALIDDPQRPAIVIDVDDIDSETERDWGRLEECSRFERLERYYLPRADHVIAGCTADARGLAERYSIDAVTAIPNAVALPDPNNSGEYRTDLLFVGNLSYAPNVEAVRWLCESVLPQLDEVTVTIVGSRPGAEVLGLARNPQVTVIADPEDVTPCYAAARVAVVPLKRGGGSRLKLIEALAHRVPVVSTTAGARGQPWDVAAEPAGCVVADEPQAFAAACRELLAAPDRAREMGARGRAQVSARASLDVIAARVAALAEEVVRRRSVSAGGTRTEQFNRPLLTAALIVRDEEAVLDACLESLNGLADEIVIVDTGSTDASVSLAEAHGARVLHQQWNGDFSTPRNLGLDEALGEWILYIDADERVAAIDRRELELKLGQSAAIALRILLSPTSHATPYFEYRLWRNDPRIRFRGVMHEQVVDAIHEAAGEDGRTVDEWAAMRLDHIGYEGDQTRKHTRNLPLLQAQLSRDPSNVYNWRHLARVLDALGRQEEARQALERAVALAVAEPTPSVDGGLAWAELVRAEHERGNDVAQLLSVGRDRWPDHWLICWIEGIVALEAGRLSEAEQSFRSLLAVDLAALPATGIAYDTRMFGEWAQASLGLTLLRAGRDAEAAGAYAQAERCSPDNLEYRTKRALAEARANRPGTRRSGDLR